MLATRDGFGEQLALCGQSDPNILVLGADLSKATKCSVFKSKCPGRFFEIGIAEANMIGIASGLSSYGYRVFISSFASFLTGRYDIIRCSLAYSNAPVVIVGTHSGLAIGKDGVTQMGTEDINLMRGMPNMRVYQPATALEARKITEYLCKSNELAYLRLGRQPVPECFDSSYQFAPGKGQVVRDGSDLAIFSTGCVLPDVLKAAESLSQTGFSCAVVNMATIKPIDRDIILQYADSSKMLISVEDHSIIGGLGSAISEVLTDSVSKRLVRKRLVRIGINDTFAESGKPEDLYEKYGLSANKIRERIKAEISNNLA